MNQKVLKEAIRAYADCNMGWEKGEHIRNLGWVASETVTKEDAIEIMKQALGEAGSYNDFTPEAFNHLPDGVHIKLARESSVAAYIDHPKLTEEHREKMNANEFDYYDGNINAYRFWWD